MLSAGARARLPGDETATVFLGACLGQGESRAISRSNPQITALYALSPSRSIRSSPKVRVSGCSPVLADPVDAVEIGKVEDGDRIATALTGWAGSAGRSCPDTRRTGTCTAWRAAI